MRNPQRTKEIIIRESANLFNVKGYKATSLSDITTATGFTKGAIYKHFNNKEDLEQQALRNLGKMMLEKLNADIKSATNFESKMETLFKYFKEYLSDSDYKGGCPLMNSACESDDTDPGLRQQSFGMLINFKSIVKRIFEKAIINQEIKKDINIDQYTITVIAILEGAIMMSKLERTDDSLQNCFNFIREINKKITIVREKI